MYTKEEFSNSVYESPFFSAIVFWLGCCARPTEINTIKQKHPEMPDDLENCYIWEAAKWYAQMKMTSPEDFTFRKNGMKLEDDVYYYPPYTPGLFLGILYLIFECDTYKWEKDLKLQEKLRLQMENLYPTYLHDVERIIENKWINKADIESKRLKDDNRYVNQKVQNAAESASSTIYFRGDVNEIENESDIWLSVLFSRELLTNASKRTAFVKVIHDVVTPKVDSKKGSREAKWRWPHLQQALFDSGHILTMENMNEFGRSLAPITGCAAENITQALKRYVKKSTDANIVLEIRKVIDDALRANKQDPT